MNPVTSWLNEHLIAPFIVYPLKDYLNAIAVAIQRNIDEIKYGLGIDKRSRRIPLIFVQDLSTRFTLKGDITSMQLSDSQKCRIEFGKPLDKKGNAAQVQDGSVSISVTDDSAHFEPDPNNPFAGTIVADKPTADPTAPGAIVISADADLGDGVNNIQGVEPLIVTAGAAVGFGPATIGTPEEQ